jgi:HK97 family phage portal protein
MNFKSIKRFFSTPIYLTGYTELPSTKIIFPDGRIHNSAMDICTSIIANTVASIPINLYKDVEGFKDVLRGDIRYNMLHNRPNGYTNRYVFWHTMELAKQRYGNSYALIHKFPNEIVLEYMHPLLLVEKPFFKGGFLKYKFKTNDGNRIFDSSDIIHFKRDSIDGITGIDPYEELFEDIKRTYFANKTIANYYENDGKSTKFIKSTLTVGDANKIDKAANKFREESGGSYLNENNKIVKGDFDKIIAYPRLPGNTEIQELANDQNDALYLATIEKADLNIAAHYGVPPHYLNIMQAQKNNNVETLQLDFKSSTIAHTLNQNRQELQMKLLTSNELDEGMSIEYNANAILELSSAERMAQYESLQKTAGMAYNEVRKIEGMKRIENGDEHYIFNQMAPLEDINKDASVN